MKDFFNRYRLLFSALLCCVWVGAFAVLTDRLSSDRLREQEKALNTSIERCMLSCYALEGFYPPDLEYMKEHYGLSYDEKHFWVDYQPSSANLRPYYMVIQTQGE